MNPAVAPFGDRAVLVEWSVEGYSDTASIHALGLSAHLRRLAKFTEVVPGYASVMAEFDPSRFSLEDAVHLVNSELPRAAMNAPHGKTVDIPVRYGGEDGPDMGLICESSGLSEADVIDLHASEPYRVCMMGFIPGFAFLSEVPAVLARPRHAVPRERVPAGSVGIAGWQTGVYGLDSPGGWNIIGRTDLNLFDVRRDAPFLVEAGDSIRFVPA